MLGTNSLMRTAAKKVCPYAYLTNIELKEKGTKFTELFGRCIMVLFQKASRWIILMLTHSTIEY